MATINGSYQKVQNISGELDTLHLSAIQALPGRTVVDPLTGNVTPANPRGLLGFFGATAIVQPDTTITAATIVAGGVGAVFDDTTYDGYTIAKVVAALKDLGLLA